MSRLPARRAFRLESQPEEHRWLVHGLWADQAVGVLGGEPKCCKSFCALDVAVSVGDIPVGLRGADGDAHGADRVTHGRNTNENAHVLD